MSELVAVSRQGDVAVITVNNPPVNALSPGVPEGIRDAIVTTETDDEIKGIVLIGGGRTFIAGADIREFAKATSGEKELDRAIPEVLRVLEECGKPVVCAIHGTALGGGLEIAMACHYRVALGDARVGQPEVKLGLIPGAGGTQRLPRLAGIAMAAEMCATGRFVGAQEARESGILDRVVDGDLLEGAVAFTRDLGTGEPPRKTREIRDRLGDAAQNAAAIATLKQQLAKRARGLQAPLKAIEAVEWAATMSFDDACRRESQVFMECLNSDESKGLVHVFLGERAVSKLPDISPGTTILEIGRAAVVGAGTMGGGIAMCYANAGIPVMLKEIDQQRLDAGLEVIRRNYGATVKKGRLTEEKLGELMALITPTLDYADLADADIVVEAVFEDMALKKKVFAEIDEVARDGAILASNTSTLDIDEIASATRRPEMVIGHHFFSPANVMRLLEIVRGEKSSGEVIASSMKLAKRLRKVGVLVGNCTGFVGNRMFLPYLQEANFLVEEGATVEEVDAALYQWGMAMGPLAVDDLAGIDVRWRIHQEHAELGPQGSRQPLLLDRLFEAGRYGQKTGAGWYRYEKGNRRPIPDPEVEKLVRECASVAGIEQRDIQPQEIIERTVYGLINEGAKILEEGFAQRAVDIDIVYIYGYGFPAHRGGPMLYADTVGLDRVHARIRDFSERFGDGWQPAPLLQRLAEAGSSFTDFDRQRGG